MGLRVGGFGGCGWFCDCGLVLLGGWLPWLGLASGNWSWCLVAFAGFLGGLVFVGWYNIVF